MRKIMQCLMGLDIGGAETHVVELSKVLAAQGHEVVVASNGGIYENELKVAGVHVLKIPMHTKNPVYAFKSLIILHQEIKKFKPDIVHSHARIPAFYVSIMKWFHSFKMMTTVHGNFKVNWLLKHITQWGEDIFVVSEDVENYLKAHYALKGEIHRTINGIDTEKFCETKVNYPYKRLIHVSRLEHNTSKMANALIEVARELNLEILIVGGGSELEYLKRKADGIKNISFTGDVVSVHEILMEGDLFIGISRAALEAMSMGIPVILGGEYGYLGILDESKLDIGVKTNFTARIPKQLSNERIKEDIENIRNMPPNLFEWQRPYIKEHFSLLKMVADYSDVYMKFNKVLVIGYYGSNNLGDELLLKETLTLLDPYASKQNITVLSYNVDQTEQIYKVKGVSRNKYFEIVKAIMKTDIIVGGGGSMLQNVTSNRSLIYYLTLIRLGLFFRKKVMLLGNGIGPIFGIIQTAMVKRTLKSLDLLHIRDGDSYHWIEGKFNEHIILGQDLALFSGNNVEDFQKKNKILINLRNWADVDRLIEIMKPFSAYLNNKGYEVCLLCMQAGNDDEVLSRLGYVKVFESLEELDQAIASTRFSIGMRLHTLILCANYNIPFIGLSYDPKVKAFCEDMGMPYFDDFKKISVTDLIKTFELLEADESRKVCTLMDRRAEVDRSHQELKCMLDQQIRLARK